MKKNFISVLAVRALQNPTFVDCRWSLKEPTAYGPAEYAKGHLPNAIFADMDRDLAAPEQPDTGRHPLPAMAQFAAWLKANRLQKEKDIICYDDAGAVMAARLWWMLRCLGYPNVKLLDGGIQAWRKEGLPTETAAPTPSPADIGPVPADWAAGHMPVFTVEEMVNNITSARKAVVDARPAPRFNSKGELVWPDPVTGHYPQAVNWPTPQNLAPDMHLKPLAELRSNAEAAFKGHQAEDIVFHCGSGVTACFDIAIAEEVGLGTPALYVGGWSQWCKLHPEKVEHAP